jgi:putative tryptophan/tyrosine transport system substrate-binding protein
MDTFLVIQGGFIAGLGSVAAINPLAARAQAPLLPVIGRLTGGQSDISAAFRAGLGEFGYVDGQNVLIENRTTEGQNDRLPSLATDFVRRQVAVIVAGGYTAATDRSAGRAGARR